MASVLVFDIETIPDAHGLKVLHQGYSDLSDEEAISRAQEERKAQVGHDFMPHYLHKIVAISCVLRRTNKDGQPQLYVGSLGQLDSSEEDLIQQFFDLIEKYTPQLVSWNGSGFDLPVLHYRSLIHGVTCSRYWEMGESTDVDSRDFKWNNYINRYHMRHLDLMDILAKFSSKANAPLDSLAKLCGFPGKMGMDGSQVWNAYSEGQLQSIRDYCETDVVNTYLMYCRYQLMRGGMSSDEYQEEIEFVKNAISKLSDSQTGKFWQEYLSKFSEVGK